MREEEALEESTKASAQSVRKRQAEEGDEEVILTKALWGNVPIAISVTSSFFFFFFLLLLHWEYYNKPFAQAEADHQRSFEKEFAKMEKEHKNTIDAMGKPSDTEKERSRAALEKCNLT